MYLIAHLQDRQAPGIKDGAPVSPGQLVAYSRKTGTSLAHLHVSYYDVQYDEDVTYLDNKDGILVFNAKLIGFHTANEKNPLNH